MKAVNLPSDAVLVLVTRATETGPHVDVHVSEEWWAGASKDHRKAVFMAALQALGAAGGRVIPEEFGGEAGRPVEKMPAPGPLLRLGAWLDRLLRL